MIKGTASAMGLVRLSDDAKNLWPEHWSNPRGAHERDVIETKLKRLVCAGETTLADGTNTR